MSTHTQLETTPFQSNDEHVLHIRYVDTKVVIAETPDDTTGKEDANKIIECWNHFNEAKELIIEMGKMLIYDDIYPEGSKGYNLSQRAISFIGKLSS
jgi:hypothetical protein